ncbi:STAN-like protein [Mya arenaria]|uniref:STAN-like protein n=1 Tax=Mya arenaria TaxID=6604 RepID=A0ABY7EJW2_MYAAR|nr:STAN-like protein [Mya arenaria]
MSKGTLGTSLIVALCLFQGCEAAVTAWTHPGTIATPDGSFTIASGDGKAEDTTAGTALFTATATVGGTASYELVDDAGGKGSIVAATGVVSLATGQTLDYETATTLVFKVKATDDGGGAVGTATITLPITDVNEAPTYANAQNEACAVDNSAADTVIGTYTATDQDSAGNTNTDFTYGTDGKIKVATSKTLDMSTTATYTLVLHATDDDGTALTGSSTVTVSVQAACGAGAIGAMFASVLLAAIVSYLI